MLVPCAALLSVGMVCNYGVGIPVHLISYDLLAVPFGVFGALWGRVFLFFGVARSVLQHWPGFSSLSVLTIIARTGGLYIVLFGTVPSLPAMSAPVPLFCLSIRILRKLCI